jgi:sugar-specific transcriptional regulator TrmB
LFFPVAFDYSIVISCPYIALTPPLEKGNNKIYKMPFLLRKMIDQLLRDIGLTEYESKIYLALIELGEATSGEIMNKANINSGRIYQILNSLKEKGIVSEITKNKVKYFSPTNPKKILEYLEDKEAKIKQQKVEVNQVIPELLSKINSQDKEAKIEIYTGFEGQRTAMLKEIERYKKGTELCVLGIKKRDFYPKKIMDFFEYNVYPKRKLNRVKIRKINDLEFKKFPDSGEDGAEIKYLDYPSTTAINVCEDLSIISIYSQEIITICIESEEVAKAFKTQFEALWKIAKK